MPRTNSDRPPIVLPAWVYVLTFRLFSRSYAVLGVALGLALILGGPGRFGSPGFATARQIPGQQFTWGTAALVAGLVMFGGSWTRHRGVLRVGNAALVVWHLFFAITLGLSALQDEKAGLTGWITYGAWAGLGVALIAALQLGGRPE